MKYTLILAIFINSTSLFAQTGKWQQLPTDFDNDLYGIYFTDSLTGYICGENGLILKTIDGINWLSQQTPTNQTLYDIKFANDTIGWACGDSGTILSTQNGGNDWDIISENFVKPFHELDILNVGVNEYSIWVVGDSISALKIFNQDWSVYYINMNRNFIIFENDFVPDAIIVDSIALWEGYNYGTIWGLIWYFTNEQLAVTRLYKTPYGIWSNNFWFVGRNGSAHYCDMPFIGWPIFTSLTPVNSDLLSVAVDETAHKVWAVGINGTIIASENEGVSYDLVDSPVFEDLNDIFFPGFETGYTVGNNGIILHYEDDWVINIHEKDNNNLVTCNPNPFKSIVEICFPDNTFKNFKIFIYDIFGNIVRNMNFIQNNSYNKKLIWDGSDNNGIKVNGGVYYMVIKTNDFSNTIKLIKSN